MSGLDDQDELGVVGELALDLDDAVKVGLIAADSGLGVQVTEPSGFTVMEDSPVGQSTTRMAYLHCASSSSEGITASEAW